MHNSTTKSISALALLCCFAAISRLSAQSDASLFRFPDVSATQIVFTYANDVWVVPIEGGTAIKLSSPSGVESFPKFSPDGKTIAYTANYDGNWDVFSIPVNGGIPQRLTQHGWTDRVVDWTPDGKSIVFASGRESEKERYSKFFTIPATGGAATTLPLAYAEFGTYSADGNQMALVFRSEAFRTWKRYRGGDVADIYIFNFQDQSSYNISSAIDAGEEFPMWYQNTIYFLSDNGPEKRMNIWKYDLTSKSRTQVTHFTDYDVHFPSLGPNDIVLEAGGKMYLLGLQSNNLREISIHVITDHALLKPRTENVSGLMQSMHIGPDGNRVVVEARGELFSVPAENGYIKNLTQNSGTAERSPAWSPDGKHIAYWSDASGEYELWMLNTTDNTPAKQITQLGKGFRYSLFWSPDSKSLAFVDQSMRIWIVDATSGAATQVDKGLQWAHYNLEAFTASWSPDSRYLAYTRDLDNGKSAAFIYDVQNKKTHQVTSGFYHTNEPVFDPSGKYLFVLTSQSLSPLYSDLDNTFIYPNTTQIGVISLKKDIASILAPKNDMVEIKKEEDTAEKTDDKKDKNKKDDKDTAAEKDKTPVTEIDFTDMESRMVILPVSAGNITSLGAAEGKVLFIRYPNAGTAENGTVSLKYYDIDKREEKTILDGVWYYALSADGKKVLVVGDGQTAVVAVEEGQKYEKILRTSELEMVIDPMAEWKQLFMDTWRIERDYFYDANMHGVNWDLMKERYLHMLAGATTREEVNVVIGDMIAELNASHAYRFGGDLEETPFANCGYLGINWKADGKYYRVDKILRGASWDAEVRSPLDAPGIDITEGQYILAVNGIPILTTQEPFAYFQGLANKTVEITYNTTPTFEGAKTAIVQTLESEGRLRNLAWIEYNRKRVEEATNGQAGYVYVPSTGVDGQTELIRQFTAQIDKPALIIDERFNNGGQIPDRFIEMLDRDPLVYWAIRDGKSWQWPPVAHFGPKVMLINGWSGSGGDAFPDYFKRKELGPLVGQRTWGGLIGISGVPNLIDGGAITSPTFRMYYPDGTWFKEGHGVDPDILVEEDLSALAKGRDAQLERAIEEALKLIKTEGYQAPQRPAPEVR